MRQSASPSGPKNDINVTPLVDVVLVLLIIFMVITPMLQKGAEVQLPITEHPIKAKSAEDQVTITVKQQGEIYWEAEPKSEAELMALLSQKFSVDRGARIFIKGDRGAQYGRVRQVMKIIQDAGFQNVGVITKEREGG